MHKMNKIYLSNSLGAILPLNADLSDFELPTEFTDRFARRMPFDSATKACWTHVQINRVLIDNYRRAFDPDVPRDVQDLFVYLIRNRTKMALVKFRLDQMADELDEIEKSEERMTENGWLDTERSIV